jgi:hypothetical protein
MRGCGGDRTNLVFKPPGADQVPRSQLRNDIRLVLVQGTGPDIGSLAHQKRSRLSRTHLRTA